jgi:hypothetical protein
MNERGNPTTLKSWRPGQSGNPAGRRSDKRLVRYLLKETRNGEELAEILLRIARSAPRYGDKLEALKVLLDRLFGRVPFSDRLAMDVDSTSPISIEASEARAEQLRLLRAMTPEERQTVREITQKAHARAQGNGAAPAVGG